MGQEAFCTICKFQFTRIQQTRSNLQEFNGQGSTYKNSTNKVQLTRFYEQGSTNKVLRTRTTFKRWSHYSPTSSQGRVLVKQASVVAYLTRFAVNFFSPTICQTWENKKLLPTSYVRGNFSTFPQPRILFWFTSSGFLNRPILLKYWLLHPFFYKEATCESSTVKGLLYAAKAVPSKDYFTHLTLKNARKGRWVISPDYRASHPRRFCAVGKEMTSLGTDFETHAIWQGSCCDGLCSEEGLNYRHEQSARKLS